MDLTPLNSAAHPIPLHAYAAMGAIVLGIVQLLAKKGTATHKFLGYSWVTLMMIVAVSGLWIHKIKLFGIWSPIHLLSIATIALLVYAVRLARRGNIRGHKRTMTQLYVLALIVTGAFTLLPGRIMHQVFFQ